MKPSSFKVIPVLFEDEDLVLVNKPHSVPVHATHDKARPHVQGLLEKQLGQNLVLFHRLDLETTGVLAFGKNPAINKVMTDRFREREVKKKYWAVVDGRWLETWAEVQTFIKKVSGGRYENVAKGRGGDSAHTLFRVIDSLAHKTLIEAELLTGRTHQIRLHCSFMNHPILGDKLYGRKDPHGVPMALHARELSFCHPIKNELVSVQAPFPGYWEHYWFLDSLLEAQR